MRYLSTSPKIYQDFVDIDEGSYHTLVRFYESNSIEITSLKFEAYFEVLLDYTNALFEIGMYSKYILEIDKIIQLSIQQNIQFYKGEDIYFKSLFQKATSYYNTLEYQKAEHILMELIKMTPYHGLSIRLLKKCLASSQPFYIKNTRAASIFIFLTAALITAVEILYIHPFASHLSSCFEYLRFGLLGLGLFVLITAYYFHRYQINRVVNSYLVKIRN